MDHTRSDKAIRILLVTNGLVLLAGAMLGPIYALFVERIGGDLLDASLTGGLFALAAGVTTLFAGRFADGVRYDEKIVSAGYALIGVGFLLYIFVDSIWFLFAVQILIGCAEAFYSPAFDVLYSKFLNKRRAGRQWGEWESMNYFSMAGGAVLGGLIAKHFGFSILFAAMAGLCFLSSAYVIHLHKEIRPRPQK